jgi:hypothetical protein
VGLKYDHRFRCRPSLHSGCVELMFYSLHRVPARLPARPGGPHAFGGPHHLQGFSQIIWRVTSFDRPISIPSGCPFLLKGNFYSVFAISTLNVPAHNLILGSVQHLYASYISVLFVPPTLFLSHLIFSYISLFLCPVCWDCTRTFLWRTFYVEDCLLCLSYLSLYMFPF